MQKGPDVKFKLRSSQRVVDGNNRIIMAEGRMALLEAIVETGSINRAAKSMGMAYKSAWSKIRSTEKHLQAKIVHSDKSQGTRLTQTGRDLLQRYRQVKALCLTSDDMIFESVFNAAGDGSAAPDAGVSQAPPIISFVGHSGSGKTTIIEKLIPLLAGAGLKVAIIKHDVHGFEMDKPGKDTWRHKKAGAAATIISSATQIGLVMDADHDHQPEELAPLLRFTDLIITEGYKRGSHFKIEVFRPAATGDPKPLCRNDPRLLAIISDDKIVTDRPVFGTYDIKAVADFLISHIASI